MTDDRLKKLMEVAEKPLKVPIKKIEYSSSVFQYIAEQKLKSSENDVILFSVIYYRYAKWCKNNNLKRKAPNAFSEDFSKKFDKATHKRLAAYYVSPEGFDMTAEFEQEAQQYLQDVKSAKKEKKKANRQLKAD